MVDVVEEITGGRKIRKEYEDGELVRVTVEPLSEPGPVESAPSAARSTPTPKRKEPRPSKAAAAERAPKRESSKGPTFLGRFRRSAVASDDTAEAPEPTAPVAAADSTDSPDSPYSPPPVDASADWATDDAPEADTTPDADAPTTSEPPAVAEVEDVVEDSPADAEPVRTSGLLDRLRRRREAIEEDLVKETPDVAAPAADEAPADAMADPPEGEDDPEPEPEPVPAPGLLDRLRRRREAIEADEVEDVPSEPLASEPILVADEPEWIEDPEEAPAALVVDAVDDDADDDAPWDAEPPVAVEDPEVEGIDATAVSADEEVSAEPASTRVEDVPESVPLMAHAADEVEADFTADVEESTDDIEEVHDDTWAAEADEPVAPPPADAEDMPTFIMDDAGPDDWSPAPEPEAAMAADPEDEPEPSGPRGGFLGRFRRAKAGDDDEMATTADDPSLGSADDGDAERTEQDMPASASVRSRFAFLKRSRKEEEATPPLDDDTSDAADPAPAEVEAEPPAPRTGILGRFTRRSATQSGAAIDAVDEETPDEDASEEPEASAEPGTTKRFGFLRRGRSTTADAETAAPEDPEAEPAVAAADATIADEPAKASRFARFLRKGKGSEAAEEVGPSDPAPTGEDAPAADAGGRKRFVFFGRRKAPAPSEVIDGTDAPSEEVITAVADGPGEDEVEVPVEAPLVAEVPDPEPEAVEVPAEEPVDRPMVDEPVEAVIAEDVPEPALAEEPIAIDADDVPEPESDADSPASWAAIEDDDSGTWTESHADVEAVEPEPMEAEADEVPIPAAAPMWEDEGEDAPEVAATEADVPDAEDEVADTVQVPVQETVHAPVAEAPMMAAGTPASAHSGRNITIPADLDRRVDRVLATYAARRPAMSPAYTELASRVDAITRDQEDGELARRVDDAIDRAHAEKDAAPAPDATRIPVEPRMPALPSPPEPLDAKPPRTDVPRPSDGEPVVPRNAEAASAADAAPDADAFAKVRGLPGPIAALLPQAGISSVDALAAADPAALAKALEAAAKAGGDATRRVSEAHAWGWVRAAKKQASGKK